MVAAIAAADPIDDVMRSVAGAAPGAVVLVSQHGKPIRFKAYGLANLELKTPVNRDTVFEIGSVSKQFTTFAVLALVDEGKVSLDAPIGTYLPETPEKWRPLTLRQLLSHTSGLKDTMQALDDPKFKATDYAKKMGDLPFDFEPGTSWSYSNTGFNLAAEVVQAIEKKKIAEVLKTRIFTPLKMSHTRYTDPTDVVPNRAHGYAVTGPGKFRNILASYPETALGAGTLMSTVDDMAKWDAAVLSGKLLSEKTRNLWFTPNTTGETTYPYGLGWFLDRDQGRPIYEHGGNTMGFSCSNLLLPSEGASITVLTNGAGIGGSNITRRLAAVVFPSYNLRKRKHEADPDPTRILRLAMNLRKFGRGQYTNLDAFAPNMKGTLSSVRGAMSRMGLGAVGKSLETYRHIDSEDLGEGRTLSRYEFVVKGGVLGYMQVTWSKDGKAEQFGQIYAEAK